MDYQKNLLKYLKKNKNVHRWKNRAWEDVLEFTIAIPVMFKLS